MGCPPSLTRWSTTKTGINDLCLEPLARQVFFFNSLKKKPEEGNSWESTSDQTGVQTELNLLMKRHNPLGLPHLWGGVTVSPVKGRIHVLAVLHLNAARNFPFLPCLSELFNEKNQETGFVPTKHCTEDTNTTTLFIIILKKMNKVRNISLYCRN